MIKKEHNLWSWICKWSVVKTYLSLNLWVRDLHPNYSTESWKELERTLEATRANPSLYRRGKPGSQETWLLIFGVVLEEASAAEANSPALEFQLYHSQLPFNTEYKMLCHGPVFSGITKWHKLDVSDLHWCLNEERIKKCFFSSPFHLLKGSVYRKKRGRIQTIHVV